MHYFRSKLFAYEQNHPQRYQTLKPCYGIEWVHKNHRSWSIEVMDNAHNTSGTPGYMAPEVMCHKNHGFAADYFAVGVLAY